MWHYERKLQAFHSSVHVPEVLQMFVSINFGIINTFYEACRFENRESGNYENQLYSYEFESVIIMAYSKLLF